MNIPIVTIDESKLRIHAKALYKNIEIADFNRLDIEALEGLLAISTRIFDKQFNIVFKMGKCRKEYPLVVNRLLFNLLHLSSLMYALREQNDKLRLQEILISTPIYEQAYLNEFKDDSEYAKYLQSLNDSNTLKFTIQEFSLEKTIEIQFLKNIYEIYESYIEKCLDDIIKVGERNESRELLVNDIRDAHRIKVKLDSMFQQIQQIDESQ